MMLSKKIGRKTLSAKRNFSVFTERQGDLFIQCFTVVQSFQDDDLDYDYIEKVRYVLVPEGTQKWNSQRTWHIGTPRDTFISCDSDTEPVFETGMNSCDNSYTMIGEENIKKSFLRYALSCISSQTSNINDKFISYLLYFTKHPNIEFLMKTGFSYLVQGNLHKDMKGVHINYKSNDLKKMLKLNKEELELLANKDCNFLSVYYFIRKLSPDSIPSNLFKWSVIFENVATDFLQIINISGISFEQAAAYGEKIKPQHIREWRDYLSQCVELGYDVHNKNINRPKNLHQKHEELSVLVKIKIDKEIVESFNKRMQELEALQYYDEELGLQIKIPSSMEEIIDEGTALKHCVGSYAKRHAQGLLNILFIRRISEPNTPFYTMEVSDENKIIQCKGIRNTYNDPLVAKFQERFACFLNNYNIHKIKNQDCFQAIAG